MKWIEKKIRQSKTAKKIERESWERAVDDLQEHLVILDGDCQMLHGCNFDVPSGKNAVLVRGTHIAIANCVFTTSKTGVVVKEK